MRSQKSVIVIRRGGPLFYHKGKNVNEVTYTTKSDGTILLLRSLRLCVILFFICALCASA